jgi:integrase
LRTPLPKARGVEVLPTDAEVEKLLSVANERLRPVIEALIDTGSRPIEVFRVTADQFDAAAATWTLAKRKTARVRVVHLTPRVRDHCVAAAARWPTGPLYRLRKGAERDAASESTWLSWTFSVKRKRLGLRRGITPYSLRHSFATTALAIGESENVVAELLGNSVAVLRQHYNHLAGRPDALRDALKRTRGG